MKFLKYMNEEKIEDIITLLEKDCKPFLKDWKNINKGSGGSRFLYSGRPFTTTFTKKSVRKNRKPTDTPIELHNLIDNWFNKKFGFKLRSSSIFATFLSSIAVGYGKPYLLFPIGKYEAYWSPRCRDLYTKLMDIYYDTMPRAVERLRNYDSFSDNEKKELKENILLWLNNKSKYQKGLKYTDNEIMIYCKEYYLIDDIKTIDIYKHFLRRE